MISTKFNKFKKDIIKIANNDNIKELVNDNSIKDLNYIITTNVTSMKELFFKSRYDVNISHWDVSNVVDMSFMFWNSKFIHDISQWDVSKVRNMKYMF